MRALLLAALLLAATPRASGATTFLAILGTPRWRSALGCAAADAGHFAALPGLAQSFSSTYLMYAGNASFHNGTAVRLRGARLAPAAG